MSKPAGADVAAALLDAVCERPALVVHRRRDRAMRRRGASWLHCFPDARLVALEGELHPPWLGDHEAALAALTAFLDQPHAARRGRAAASRWNRRTARATQGR